jgi:CHAD domain-containing protein
MCQSKKLTIVYLEHGILLTKKHYQSLRDIQDEFKGYKASLGPWRDEEVVEYLAEEYLDMSPSAEAQVRELTKSVNEKAIVTFHG